MRAWRARFPRVIALARRLKRRAHLRHRPIGLVEGYGLGLRPLCGKACSCLLAKRALAFKSISFSRLSRSFSLSSPRGSSAIWNGLASGADPAASAFPTQFDRLPAPQPGPRATSAYVVPDFPYGSTASCLNSAVCLGDGLPMACLAFPRRGHRAETEIDLSTDLGQIQCDGTCCDLRRLRQRGREKAAPGVLLLDRPDSRERDAVMRSRLRWPGEQVGFLGITGCLVLVIVLLPLIPLFEMHDGIRRHTKRSERRGSRHLSRSGTLSILCICSTHCRLIKFRL